jgi:DNA-binding response OmpR family regulator
MKQSRVLLIEADQDAARLFELLLGSHVEDVIVASTVEEAFVLAQDANPSAIVVGGSATFRGYYEGFGAIHDLARKHDATTLYCATVNIRDRVKQEHTTGRVEVLDLPGDVGKVTNALRVLMGAN